MTAGILHDQSMEKQMGCMAGFLQIFDRHHILAGKRIYATKRLPSSTVTDSTSNSEKAEGSPVFLKEQQQQEEEKIQLKSSPSSPKCVKSSPSSEIKTQMPVHIPPLELKEGFKSSWKFRESPRLSLDSRASVDGKGSLYPREIRANAAILSANRCNAEDEENDKQRRSPSVIARLMGLEALPESTREPLKKPELRRSASESRSRDLLQYRFIEGNYFHQKQMNSGSYIVNNAMRENTVAEDHRLELSMRKLRTEPMKISNISLPTSPWKSQYQQRKSFFDSQDFFPEPKQTSSLYGELEKRLKMRGINEPAEDLETLKQILEALQLKGLLHSKRTAEQIRKSNFVFDRKFSSEETPIVVMKPSKSLISKNHQTTIRNNSPPSNLRSKAGARRNLNVTVDILPPVSPRRDRPVINRKTEKRVTNSMSPDRNESNARSPCSPARRKSLTVETQRRGNDSVEQRRSSPVHSPKINNRSPRNNKKSTAEISPKERISITTDDESSSISESCISTSSQIDTKLQRSKTEDYREGKSLLARCDKLLNSIAEITTTDSQPSPISESQPSPVSVLDSSFYKDELSPLKRCIDFKDQSVELEEEVISPVRLKSDDSDFNYVYEIFQASQCTSEESDLFFLLEKQHYKTNSSNVSRLHRKLVFEAISEILDKKKQLPPWKVISSTNPTTGKPSFQQIWAEFLKMRKISPAEDLFEVICGVLRKDLAGEAINEWEDCPTETSEVVLDIERMIYKDLVGEIIQDLASFACKGKGLVPRRKLVF